MPTALRNGPYRCFFYAGDREELAHVHVERDTNVAKFWLDSVRLVSSGGFGSAEIGRSQKLFEEHREELLRIWMSSSTTETTVVRAASVTLTDDALVVELSDGRSISAPLAWYPRLLHGTTEERSQWRLIGAGVGIRWTSLDEDISVENLLTGRASGESQRSLKRWLEQRASSGARRR